MYSVLCSDINTENTLESLIALSFPSKAISNFSVRRKPEESVNTEIYIQGILLEKFDENRGESVKSETFSKNQKSNIINNLSNSSKNDLKINGNNDFFGDEIFENEMSQKNELSRNTIEIGGKKEDGKGGIEIVLYVALYCIVLYCIA